MEEKQTSMGERVKQATEELINKTLDEGLKMENIDFLYKMIDIHKDIANEEYWEVKKEGLKMRYRNYNDSYGYYEDNRFGNYGRRARDSRGRYMGNDDTLKTLMSSYDNYCEYKERYGANDHSTKENTVIALDYMLQSVVEFMQMLKHEAGSQEEIDLIRHYSKQISEI